MNTQKKDRDVDMKDEEAKEEDKITLTKAQENMIDTDVARKLKKDRGLDGSIKLVREKVPFIW